MTPKLAPKPAPKQVDVSPVSLEDSGSSGRLQRFQTLLEHINKRYGALGSLISMGLLVTMLYYALIVILEEYF